MAERKIWYEDKNVINTEAVERRYQGQMAKDRTAQMKKPRLTVMYLGASAAISFPAGMEFSKIAEKIVE
jgi:hypothetical protein